MSQQLLTNPSAIKPARNFAPLAPLLSIRDNAGPKSVLEKSSLGEAIRERFKDRYNLERKIRESMVAAGYQIALFIEGKQFLTRDRWAPNQWVAYKPKRPSDREKRAMNFTRFYASNALWKWQLSNPDIVAIPGIDTEQARESAGAADLIVEKYERKFFGPVITIQEAFQGLCFGTYAWEVYYNAQEHSVTAIQPIFDIKPVTLGPGWGQCSDCGYADTADKFSQTVADPFSPPVDTCPDCGGEAMVDQPAQELLPTMVGVQPVRLGELCIDLKPFPELAWDFRFPIEQSSWLIHQRATSLAAVHRAFGPIRLPGGGEGMDDYGLKTLAKLAWASGGGGGQASNDETERKLFRDPANVVTFSLGPDDIADIVLTKDEETVDGNVIPAGPLLDTFPEGMTVQGLNGLTVITSIDERHHSRTYKNGVWHSKPMSGTGQGFDDVVEVQKRFNATDSQILTFLRASSTPAMRVLKQAVSEENRGQYLGDPAMNVTIDGNQLPEGMRPDQAVGPVFKPQSVPAQFFGYTYQHLNNFAQLTSHITDFTGGLPGVKNNTATGAQITQANSNALFTPPLQVKGEVRKRIAEIVVDLYREHYPIERFFPLQGKYGRGQGRYLSAADLSTDIQFEVVRDSELPRNTFTKREDALTFLTMMGGGQGLSSLEQMNPEFVAKMRRLFNISELEEEPYDQVASLCMQRIAQLKQIADIAPDPTVLTGLASIPPMGVTQVGPGVIDPPIAMEEPAHDLKAKWLSEWLDFDEGQRAGPVLRACVVLLIQYHFQLHGMQAGEIAFQQGAIQTAGAAPGAIGGAVGGAINNEVNPQPDVNSDVPDVNKPTPVTGRPRPKAK